MFFGQSKVQQGGIHRKKFGGIVKQDLKAMDFRLFESY